MKRGEPDGLESLFAALICCLISTLMYGQSALSSMLFVACISRYHTDRNKASLPFLLSNVLQALSGPFTGYLAQKFKVRSVVLAGSIVATLGIAVCFFAEDISTIIIFWGIVFGTGFGLSTLLLPAVINDYFLKHRSVALGLCYLGSPIGFFVFPPIFEVLLYKYGLSGAFLFLAGLSMNCIPLSMLLRRPSFNVNDENWNLSAKNKSNSHLNSNCNLSHKITFETNENSKANIQNKTHLRRFSVEYLWDSTETVMNDSKQYIFLLNKSKDLGAHENCYILRSFKTTNKKYHENLMVKPEFPKELSKQPECRIRDRSSTNLETYDKFSTIHFRLFPKSPISVKKNLICERNDNAPYQLKDGVDRSNETNYFSCERSGTPTLIKYKKTDDLPKSSNDCTDYKSIILRTPIKEANASSRGSSMLNMYLNPIFIIMCFSNAISSVTFSTVTTVIIDFSRDRSIHVEYEKFLLMCVSIMGGIGMLGFGWVTDSSHLSRTLFGSLSQLFCAISLIAFPFTNKFETLMIALVIFCVFQAVYTPLIPAIIADYSHEDVKAVAVSAVYILCGPLYLAIPPLIGYFRDEKGSYDYIFFLLALLAFLNCIAVLIIPYLARWMSKR